MAISFSRPTRPRRRVAEATFSTARRGFDQQEVRDFLRMVAAELARLQERERFLERELRRPGHRAGHRRPSIDDDTASRLLGEEAARILQTAREERRADQGKAEDGAARLLREAADEAQRLREEAELEAGRRRSDAAADAEAELAMAKQQGREMVEEARPTASGCSPSWPAASWPASRSSSWSTAATACCRRSSGPGWWPSTSSPSSRRSASPTSTSTSRRPPARCR